MIPVFLHIPRAGGTSIRTALEGRFDRWELLLHDDSTDVSGLLPRQDKVALAMGHFEYNAIRRALEGRELAFFTFLREPVERVLSDYYWAQQSPLHRHHEVCKKPLEQVLLGAHYVNLDNIQTRLLGSCLDVPYGQLTVSDLLRAKEVLHSFSVVGLTEHFEDSLAWLAEDFGEMDLRFTNLAEYHVNRIERPREVDCRLNSLIRSFNAFDSELYTEAMDIFVEKRV